MKECIGMKSKEKPWIDLSFLRRLGPRTCGITVGFVLTMISPEFIHVA
jgi:hypothetical protein